MLGLDKKLSDLLIKKNMMIATAESCTGGLIATTLTHKAGASAYFERGFITYSNAAKQEQLDVPEKVLEQYGAVSAQTAELMAQGALKHSHAHIAISTTGIAGPDGGSTEKPVGLVYLGYALKGGSSGSIEHHYEGNRREIQTQATITAFKSLIAILSET